MNQTIIQQTTCSRWGIFEVGIDGPKDGNPFIEQKVTGIFKGDNETVSCDGFYDGDGVYRIRFMPSFEGAYTYQIQTTFGGDCTGNFTVNSPKGKCTWPSACCKHLPYGLRGWHTILFNWNNLLCMGASKR